MAALWRCCGEGEVSRRCRKIELGLGYPMDMVWYHGELNSDNHKWAVLTGHRHAAFGIAMAMSGTA